MVLGLGIASQSVNPQFWEPEDSALDEESSNSSMSLRDAAGVDALEDELRLVQPDLMHKHRIKSS